MTSPDPHVVDVVTRAVVELLPGYLPHPGFFAEDEWYDGANIAENVASDTAEQVAAALAPRVWRKGDPEPDVSVRAVLDRDGIIWMTCEARGRWLQGGNGEWPSAWPDLDFPLVEVHLPEPVTE